MASTNPNEFENNVMKEVEDIDLKSLKSLKDVTEAINDVKDSITAIEGNIKVLQTEKDKKSDLYMEHLQNLRNKKDSGIAFSEEDKRMIHVRRTQIQALYEFKWVEMDKIKKLEKQLDDLKELFMTFYEKRM